VGVYGRTQGIQPPLGKEIVRTAEVRLSPLLTLGSGSSKRRRLVLWLIDSELLRRSWWKPKLEKGSFAVCELLELRFMYRA
jgi:hypothetical protein